MRTARAVVACFLFLLLQIVLAPRIALGSIQPDFVLLLVAYFAVSRGAQRGAVAGFVIGLIQDLFNPELLGVNALTKSVVGYGLGVAGSKADPDSVVFLGALFGVAALGHDFLYLLFFTGLDLSRFFILWTTVSIPSALYTALVGIVVHAVSAALGSKVVRSFGKARP